jgi:hypothetical protein
VPLAAAVIAARPEALVTADEALSPADAPLPGATKLTVTPGTGLFEASFTVTPSALANCALTSADCGALPLLAVIEAGAPGLLVKLKLTEVSPADEAVTLYGPPAIEFVVAVTDATPDALVTAAELLSPAEAPEPGAAKFTVTPETGLPPLSFTVTASAAPKAVLTVALCGEAPPFAVIEAAAPAALVKLKLTDVRPAEEADTLYRPALEFAVKAVVAMPFESVETVITVLLLLNMPLGPVPGAVNVTLVPGTGLPPLSFTVTASALANEVLMVAVCGVVPAFAVIEAAAPAVLVRLKFTEVSPADEAVTL